MRTDQRTRLLSLARVLLERTDGDHGLSLPELQAHLEDLGISSERKALYRDLAALREAGLDIQKLPTRPVSYAVVTRLFTPAQMALLLDAVRTSRSLTQAASDKIEERLLQLQSEHQAKAQAAPVHVTGRVKMQNEAVLDALSLIQRALAEKRDISFAYLRYGVDKKLAFVPASDGQERVKTPLFLVYSEGNYYLLVFDEQGPDQIRSYRVDRMANVMLREGSDPEHRPSPTFDVDRYVREHVGMYNMEPARMKLIVAEEAVAHIVDMFGVDGADIIQQKPTGAETGISEGKPRRWASVHVTAAPSPVFFGQIAQFGGDVRIASPKRVAKAYAAHLRTCLQAQMGDAFTLSA